MRALALHARRLAGTPELDALLAELSGPVPYRRRVALHMAMAARDLGHVADVLAGPDMDLRKAALRAVRTLPVPDDAVARALDDAPTDLRRSVYRTLLYARRTALADRLLPDVRARHGDRDAAMLLPACSTGTVTRLLPELAHAVTMWRALAARRPDAFLDHVERELDTGNRWRVLRRQNAGFVPAARARSHRAVDLLVRTGPSYRSGALSVKVVNAFHGADPAGFASWVERPEAEALSAAISPRLCPDEVVARRLMGWSHGGAALLADLPPHRRDAVFRLAAEKQGGSVGTWAVMPLLPWLSPETAAREARRLLEWHASVWHSSRTRLDDPDIPLRLTSYLPHDEAVDALVEASTGGDPRRRGLARTLLLANAARTGDPVVVAEHLATIVRRVRNEPDPVRAELFAAVTALSPRVLSDACAEPLRLLTKAVVEARDTSTDTMRAVRRLAVRVLRHRTDPALTAWATGALADLLGRFGADALRPAPAPEQPRWRRRRWGRRVPRPDDHRLDRAVPPGGEAALLEAFAPHLQAARERGDHEVFVAVAASFRRRPTGLDDDLRRAVLHAPENIGAVAARFLLARDPERAAGLLAEDPATIALPGVWRVVTDRRTDLLTFDRDPHNRFRPWIPDLRNTRPGRWTPEQVRAARNSLDRAACDEAFDVADRLRAVASLGRLPGHFPVLRMWVRESEGAMAETALDAAANHPDALPLLFEMARGPASAVAVAGLARCAGRVRPSVLGPALTAALTSPDVKVTVRKQAARLLERHRPPGALDALLATWRAPDLHRDVRVAVAVALRHFPDGPHALEALAEAPRAHASEEMLRTLFQAAPSEYAPDARPAMATLIRACLNAADLPGVRFRGRKAFAAWARWYPGGHAATLAAAADPDDPSGDTEAMVLAALVEVGAVRDEALDVLARLAPEGLMRHRVRHLVSGLRNLLVRSAGEDGTEPLLRRAVDTLARHPLQLGTAASLHIALINADRETETDLTGELTALADLLRDRPVQADRAYGELILGGHYSGGAVSRDVLPAVDALIERGHTAAHLLALRLVRRGGVDAGWPDEWQDALARLCDSPHGDVAEPAWNMVTEEG
ncbi:hypothetical protein [Actinomadura oligospora]|uniref:hypothetical protein n=1 Tax=Actinomadura oligospora TaxID=111804 RepID=UPI00047A327A|nr:hypothetical protein [Actinomadura oligospora]